MLGDDDELQLVNRSMLRPYLIFVTSITYM